MVKILIEKGAKKEALDSDGRTPLYVAANFGHFRVVKMLLENGADMEAANPDGWTFEMLRDMVLKSDPFSRIQDAVRN